MDPKPPQTDEALLAQARTAAEGIGLAIPETCAAGVVMNLRTLQTHVDRLMVMEFPADVGPAAVFGA
jgi:hypothetical protein